MDIFINRNDWCYVQTYVLIIFTNFIKCEERLNSCNIQCRTCIRIFPRNTFISNCCWIQFNALKDYISMITVINEFVKETSIVNFKKGYLYRDTYAKFNNDF